MLLIIAASMAGTIYYTEQAQFGTMEMNTRTLESHPFYIPSTCGGFGRPGMALDVSRRLLWFTEPEAFQYVHVGWVHLDNGSFRCMVYAYTWWPFSLSFDPHLDTPITFGLDMPAAALPSAVYTIPGGQRLQSAIPILAMGMDWYEPGGYHIVMTDTELFYAVDTVNPPRFLAPVPAEIQAQWNPQELAYDSDTRVLWLFASTVRWGVDPTTWQIVAEQHNNEAMAGGAGSIDDVPDQTPELLVTGTCPGTVYVTVVDATPGSTVTVATSTRPGTTVPRAGPCPGVAVDLTAPRVRATLPVNGNGIATTAIQAPAAACGRTLVQAVDMGLCQSTSVRTVPATVP